MANRANLHVPSCDVVFPTLGSNWRARRIEEDVQPPAVSTSDVSPLKRAVAGEAFSFKVIAREGGGARIAHGGARLVAALRAPPNTTKQPGRHGVGGEPVAVRDLGDGSYEISFHPIVSGERIVVLTSGGTGPGRRRPRRRSCWWWSTPWCSNRSWST